MNDKNKIYLIGEVSQNPFAKSIRGNRPICVFELFCKTDGKEAKLQISIPWNQKENSIYEEGNRVEVTGWLKNYPYYLQKRGKSFYNNTIIFANKVSLVQEKKDVNEVWLTGSMINKVLYYVKKGTITFLLKVMKQDNKYEIFTCIKYDENPQLKELKDGDRLQVKGRLRNKKKVLGERKEDVIYTTQIIVEDVVTQ